MLMPDNIFYSQTSVGYCGTEEISVKNMQRQHMSCFPIFIPNSHDIHMCSCVTSIAFSFSVEYTRTKSCEKSIDISSILQERAATRLSVNTLKRPAHFSCIHFFYIGQLVKLVYFILNNFSTFYRMKSNGFELVSP